jgi:hypothetical protein
MLLELYLESKMSNKISYDAMNKSKSLDEFFEEEDGN